MNILERPILNTQADPRDFSPPLIRLQDSPPSPLGRRVLQVLFALLVALLLWSAIGRLDIVAVAEGKLVPQSFVKIVQPAESGIVREILVREGQSVAEGQVLMRMDALISEADSRTLEADFYRKTLTLARIDAELGERGTVILTGGLATLFAGRSPRFDVVDPDLTLSGLFLIHRRLHGSPGAA